MSRDLAAKKVIITVDMLRWKQLKNIYLLFHLPDSKYEGYDTVNRF